MLQHTAEAKRFYKSKAWRKCRDAYFMSRYGLCERCQQPGLIVHHKVYIDAQNINDATVTLNHDNLELVCQPCHNREHFGGVEAVRDDVMFDSNGDLIKR
ncbi:HNH endonuclease [Domibacillus aminovorans]|uniref:Putative HNH nuclease YajD n=1 Tax=Domibacillus aminovorans TaxID=29332 RepID=A0A177L5N5_9BACI|nr:HNH endonuclease [Domibacillus aminovorans]OAH60744.1 HNH endonuclease [Domibacillus aminovorans]